MKRFISLLFAAICMLTLLLPLTVNAAIGTEPLSLTVIMKYGETPLEGIDVAICRVADLNEISGFIYYDATSEFAGAGAEFSNLTKEKNILLAAGLNAYASANGIARTSKLTGSAGEAVFNNLSKGLYLVAQMNSETSEYIIAPYLVAVPIMDEIHRDWNYNVRAYPKTDPEKRSIKTTSVSAHKIWAGTDNPPNSILVQLYKNGSPYGDTVALSADNYWGCKWENLDPAYTWTVDEINVPAGYLKTITGSGTAGFIITNTKKPDSPPPLPPPPPPPPKPPEGPKTNDSSNAQLWIVVVAFGCAGLLAVILTANAKRVSHILGRK